LSTYLEEADCLIAAEKAFVDIGEDCRPYSPTPLAATMLITAGLAGGGETIGLLRS
jgi:hypothetical protein